MHFHCEIVIPPTVDIEAAVAAVMKPFDESERDGEGASGHPFWDFWVIGGRFAGHKLMARYDQAKLDEFHEWMQAEKITVSGLQCGKQRLQPESQIAKVDAKWNEMFPSATPVPCPIFAHSNDQYGKGLSSTLPADVVRLSDVPERLACCRAIIAKLPYKDGEPIEAGFMLCEDQWNGCNHMKVDWDGKLSTAVEKYRASLANYAPEYAEKNLPQPNWLVVTVDYHS